MAKTRGAYAPEFRRQMVELVHAGRTPEELAHEFEPTAQSIRNWVAQWERNAGRGDGGLTTAEREELSRLRRENRQLRLEREILSKAAAWFARETNAIPPKGSGSWARPGNDGACGQDRATADLDCPCAHRPPTHVGRGEETGFQVEQRNWYEGRRGSGECVK